MNVWARLNERLILCIQENEYKANALEWWVPGVSQPKSIGPAWNQDPKQVAYDEATDLITNEDATDFVDLVWESGKPPIVGLSS